MDIFKLFRSLVLACFALLVLSVAAAFFASEPPEHISAYLDEEAAGPILDALLHGSAITQAVTILLLVAYLGAWIASLFGLLGFKPWARTVFIATTVVGFALLPFAGSSLVSPFEDIIDTLLSACDGALLVLLFIEPIRGRFATLQ